MSIVSVKYWPGGRSGDQATDWRYAYKVAYKVRTSDRSVGPLAVLNAVDPVSGLAIPSIGNTYDIGTEDDATSFVQSRSCQESSEEGIVWRVDVQYGHFDPNAFPADPTLWPIRVTFGGREYERVVWFDRDGNPIVNTAFDRFGDPVTVLSSDLVMTVRRNELVRDIDPLFINDMSNTINSATWNGFTAQFVRVGTISTGDEQTAPTGDIYAQVTYPFSLNRRTWVKELLDQGYAELDGSSPPRQTPILDAQGQPVGEAVPLDGSGKRLATTGTPVTLAFDVEEVRDFGLFGINLALRYGA